MENQKPEDAVEAAALRRRTAMPRVYVVDADRSMRTFLVESLQELGFVTLECAHQDELAAALESRQPELVVIGASAGGIEACEMMELLAAREFDGRVLVLGPRVSPMVAAIRQLGKTLGLAILPLLPTPFSSGDVRDCVAPLIPVDAPPTSPADTAESLDADWLALWYQPKIDARTLATAGAEALVRVRHPTRGSVGCDDGEFHLGALADFVIARAVHDWRYFAAEHGHVDIAINLPVAFFRDMEAVEKLCRRMPDHPAFEGLMIEINAADAIHDLALMKDVARRLRFHHIAISIDGVGTEWQALSELHDFPFVELKVDRNFVAGCASDRLKQATCRRVISLADAMGARTVADGVETRADFLAAREMGFHLAQGFPHAAPMTAAAFRQTVLGRAVTLSR